MLIALIISVLSKVYFDLAENRRDCDLFSLNVKLELAKLLGPPINASFKSLYSFCKICEFTNSRYSMLTCTNQSRNPGTVKQFYYSPAILHCSSFCGLFFFISFQLTFLRHKSYFLYTYIFVGLFLKDQKEKKVEMHLGHITFLSSRSRKTFLLGKLPGRRNGWSFYVRYHFFLLSIAPLRMIAV